jgi:hypothetical protein
MPTDSRVRLGASTKPVASEALIASIHTHMRSPEFAADGEGWAVLSEIARSCRRSLTAVHTALESGTDRGLFERRPHPTRTNPSTGEPLLQYSASAPSGGPDWSP